MFTCLAPDGTPIAAGLALVYWRTLTENAWMEVPMTAVAQDLPPRPKSVPNAPGMVAFTDRPSLPSARRWRPIRIWAVERHQHKFFQPQFHYTRVRS